MGTEISTSGQAAAFTSAAFEPGVNKPSQVGYSGSNLAGSNLAGSNQAGGITPMAVTSPEKLSVAADVEALEQVADTLTQMMSITRKGLDFRVDELDGLPIVSVTDMQTGELIRQIPTEEALALAEKMSEIAGLLLKTEA